MRRFLQVSGMVAMLPLVLLAGSPAGAPRPLRKDTPARIESLAMDGSRIAYGVAAGSTPHACNTVSVWNVATHGTTRVSGPKTCDADSTSTGAGVRELAVAGVASHGS